MTGQDELMNVQVDARELRMLCEIATRAPSLSKQEMNLLIDICHHMVWDDLFAILNRMVLRIEGPIVP